VKKKSIIVLPSGVPCIYVDETFCKQLFSKIHTNPFTKSEFPIITILFSRTLTKFTAR